MCYCVAVIGPAFGQMQTTLTVPELVNEQGGWLIVKLPF